MFPVDDQGATVQMSMEDETDQRDVVSISFRRGELKPETTMAEEGSSADAGHKLS